MKVGIIGDGRINRITEEKLCKYLRWVNTPLVGNYHLYCNNPKCEEYKKPLFGDECDECEDKVR